MIPRNNWSSLLLGCEKWEWGLLFLLTGLLELIDPWVTCTHNVLPEVSRSNAAVRNPTRKNILFSLKPLILTVCIFKVLPRGPGCKIYPQISKWIDLLYDISFACLSSCWESASTEGWFQSIWSNRFCQSLELQFGWSLGHYWWQPQKSIHPQSRALPFTKEEGMQLTYIKI